MLYHKSHTKVDVLSLPVCNLMKTGTRKQHP